MTKKKFLVEFTCAEDTRWRCDDAQIARNLAFIANAVGRQNTVGSEPAVEVSLEDQTRLEPVAS